MGTTGRLRGWLCRILLPLLLTAFAVGLHAQAPAFTHLKRILVLDKSQGGATGHMESRRDLNLALAQLAAEMGFEVVTLGQQETGARVAREFSDSGLARYQAVIFSNNDGVDAQLSAASKAAFEAYVRGGGGFVAMHAASAFIGNWPFMTEALVQLFYGPFEFGGAKGNLGHDSDGLREETETRGILAGLAAPAGYADEFYGFRQSPRGEPGVAILVTVGEKPFDPAGIRQSMGADHPLVWAKRVGKGRAVGNSLGHSLASLNVYAQQGGYLKALVYRTLRYAAGDFTGCADPGYAEYNPDATKADSGACRTRLADGLARRPLRPGPGASIGMADGALRIAFEGASAHGFVLAGIDGTILERRNGRGPALYSPALPRRPGLYGVTAFGEGRAVPRLVAVP